MSTLWQDLRYGARKSRKIVRKYSLLLILCCLSPAIAGHSAGWIEPQAKPAVASARVKLNFTAEAEKFNAATEEYRGIWQTEGVRIIEAMEQVSGVKFPETEVDVIVYEGVSSSGFRQIPMKMRASYSHDIKKATLIHELGRRHLSQFRSITKDTEDHPLLFLW